jgi:SAM-dependent methyltransferase
MLYRRAVIPDRLVELWGISEPVRVAFARKESCFCSACGATLRARRLAEVLLALYPEGAPPAPAASLAAWVSHPNIQSLKIAEINVIDGLHEQLINLPGFFGSDFQPDDENGTPAQAVRSEDLTRLSYPDASFDIVLTSETLEHVPDLAAALGEIRRVLVPGGRHIFTVPQAPGVAKTFARSTVGEGGRVVDLFPRICHPGGDRGYPVFTEIGADFVQLHEGAGFDIVVFFGPNRVDDVAQVFVATK